MNKVVNTADLEKGIRKADGAAGRGRSRTARICALGLLLSCISSSWIAAEDTKQTALEGSITAPKAQAGAGELSGLDEFVHSGEIAIAAEKAAAEKAAAEKAEQERAEQEKAEQENSAQEAEGELETAQETETLTAADPEMELGDSVQSDTETEAAAVQELETEALPLLKGILCFDETAVTLEKVNPAGRRMQMVVWNTQGETLPGQILIKVSPLDAESEPLVYAASENKDGTAKALLDLSGTDGTQFKAELFIAETEPEESVEEAVTEAEETDDEALTEAEEPAAEAVTEAEEPAAEAVTEAEEPAAEAATEAEEPAAEAATEAEELAAEAVTEAEEAAAEAVMEAEEAAAEAVMETEEPAAEAATEAEEVAAEALTEENEDSEEASTEAEEAAEEESEVPGELVPAELLEGAQPLGAYRFELKNAGQDLYLSAGIDGALCTAAVEDRAVSFDTVQSVSITVFSEDPEEAGAALYEAQPDETSGMWTASIKAEDLKGEGTYQVQALISYRDGAEYTLPLTAQFHAAFEEYVNLKCTTVSKKKNVLKYRIYDIDPVYADTDLKVALWQQADQSDLNWFDAEHRPDGSYRLQAPADAYTEDYEQIHIGTLLADEMHSSAEQSDAGRQLTRSDIRISAAGDTITAENIPGTAGGLKEVRFEVWGEENGQNDLRWYRARETGGAYEAVVPFQDRIEIGTYQARMWMYYEDGSVLAGTQTQMTLLPEASAEIAVKKGDQAPGTAQVVIRSLQAKEPVTKVIARVYNEEDPPKAHWYEARQKKNGNWVFQVDASYHNLADTGYSAQLFAVTRLGRRIPIGETSFSLKAADPQILLTRRGRSPFFDVQAEGFPGAGLSLDGMTFLISSAQEPDKILAKTEAEIEGGMITGTIRMNEIGDLGEYIVRAQVEYRNASVYRLGENSLRYTRVPFTKAAQVLDKIGWDLMAAFRWSAGMTYYGHNGIMPEDDLPGIHWFANYGFDNYQGNCYVMASTFYEMAVDLGYSGRQISGGVGLRVGGIGPHSWVELDLEDGTWVFDPNFTNESGGNGFKIHYTDPGTWSYTMGDPMKLYDQRD